MRKLHLTVYILTVPILLFAQVDSADVYHKIENLLEDITLDKEDSQVFDLFEYLSNNPIFLNTASVNDLLQIPFLNSVTARAIIRHRNRLGGIYSEDQLKDIEGVNNEIIEKILLFVRLGDTEPVSIFDSISSLLADTKITFRSRTMRDLKTRTGFADGTFLGSRQKIYNRLLASSSNKFKAGVLIEKDAGEKSITDFTSFHVEINDLSFIKRAVFGNYIFEFGQGLALWSPYGFSKGSDAVGTVTRTARGAAPFISSDENQFMQGAAMKLNYGNLSFMPFFSSHKIDASIDSATNQVTSIVIDGYHRTTNEIEKVDRLKETLFGINAEYSFDEITKIGVLYYQSDYDHGFAKFNFGETTGSKFEYISACYSTVLNKILLTGEFASNKTSISSINTMELSIDINFSLIFSYRYFPTDYAAVHTNSFGERGTAQNESGFYTGIYLKTKFGSLNFYYDQFNFPIASNNYNFPSSGNDFLIYYTYKPFTNSEIRIRYKSESKDVINVIQNENSLAKRKTEKIRGEILYNVSKNFRLRTRLEYVNINSIPDFPKETGYLFFQDVHFKLNFNFDICTRIIFFRSDSYSSRLYEFENDLTGIMTNPALYGEGMRWYFIGKYKTSFGLNLSIKYSELYKPFEKSLGSGDSKIQGNLDNRLSFQLDFEF